MVTFYHCIISLGSEWKPRPVDGVRKKKRNNQRRTDLPSNWQLLHTGDGWDEWTVMEKAVLPAYTSGELVAHAQV